MRTRAIGESATLTASTPASFSRRAPASVLGRVEAARRVELDQTRNSRAQLLRHAASAPPAAATSMGRLRRSGAGRRGAARRCPCDGRWRRAHGRDVFRRRCRSSRRPGQRRPPARQWRSRRSSQASRGRSCGRRPASASRRWAGPRAATSSGSRPRSSRSTSSTRRGPTLQLTPMALTLEVEQRATRRPRQCARLACGRRRRTSSAPRSAGRRHRAPPSTAAIISSSAPIVSIISRSTPPSSSAPIWSRKAARTSSGSASAVRDEARGRSGRPSRRSAPARRRSRALRWRAWRRGS